MSRRGFIESIGATCANWTWSWSFVNHDQRFVVFGAWDAYEDGNGCRILDETWAVNAKGRSLPAYPQSREHLRLVEEEGYGLKTFPMQYGHVDPDDPYSAAKILGFKPELRDKGLLRVGASWYATGTGDAVSLPQELVPTEVLKEGAAVSVAVNAYERNRKARDACLAHYGRVCVVCGFDFSKTYGALGKQIIQVHHLVPIADVGREYVVDPVNDLVPVCPNCHAVIHSVRPAMTIEQVRLAMQQAAQGI